MNNSKYMSTSDIAHLFEVSSSTVLYWARKGYFPAPDFHAGKTIRWLTSTVENFKNKKEKERSNLNAQSK